MLLHASALSIIFIYYKRWYPTPTPAPTPSPAPTPTWRSTHFPARSRKISGKNCVADDEEEAEAEENSAKSAWQKQSVLLLLPSLSFCPVARTSQSCLPAANFSQRQAQQGGGGKRAWHAFINIYDSIKVCIRHSGGRAAAAATPAAESLSPALVVLVVLCVCTCMCVCLFVLCFMQLVSCSIKLSHEANASTKSHSKGKNCSTGSKSREKCLKIALRSHASDHWVQWVN